MEFPADSLNRVQLMKDVLAVFRRSQNAASCRRAPRSEIHPASPCRPAPGTLGPLDRNTLESSVLSVSALRSRYVQHPFSVRRELRQDFIAWRGNQRLRIVLARAPA